MDHWACDTGFLDIPDALGVSISAFPRLKPGFAKN